MDFSVYFFASNDDYDFGDRYRFILEVAQRIDELGFHAIWTPERHFQEFGGSFPSPAVLSAALAATTRNIEIRAGSVVLPHHHPVRVVEEWALVDQLSRGRVGLCLATGWHQGDFVFYPENYSARRDFTLANVSTLRRLWRGETVEFPGPDETTLSVRTYPRPYRTDLPLWLVHTSNPATWVSAGELGMNVLTLVDSWEKLAANIKHYRQAWERSGIAGRGVVTLGLHTYIGDDEEQVRALVRDPVRRYLDSFLTQKRNDAALQGGGNAMTAREQHDLAALVADDFYQRRSLLGTPGKCADVVRRAAGIGVDEVACLVDFGLPFETVLAALPKLDELRRTFARERPARTGPPSGRVPGTSGTDAAVAAGTRSSAMAWYYER